MSILREGTWSFDKLTLRIVDSTRLTEGPDTTIEIMPAVLRNALYGSRILVGAIHVG